MIGQFTLDWNKCEVCKKYPINCDCMAVKFDDPVLLLCFDYMKNHAKMTARVVEKRYQIASDLDELNELRSMQIKLNNFMALLDS